MSKFIYDEAHQRLDIENALTINKARWTDGNSSGEDRIGYFVTSANDANEVAIAKADDYVCGVTVKNDAFLGVGATSEDCVVQVLGLCKVRFDSKVIFNVGDKVMPNANGVAVKSTNNLGYRVVEVGDDRLSILISPNNDMISRIKDDVDAIEARHFVNKAVTLIETNWSSNLVSCYTDGYTCHINGYGQHLVAVESVCLKLDASCKPPGNIFFPVTTYKSSAPTSGYGFVNGNGEVRIGGIPTNQPAFFNFSFPVTR